MKANPGGIVAATDVIGRDALIDRIWRKLETLGVILVAERRIGKSTIINKMCDEAREGNLVILTDVEGISQAHEFVAHLAGELFKHKGLQGQLKTVINNIWTTLGGAEILGTFKFPQGQTKNWKPRIIDLVNALVGHQKGKIILILDEFPWMLQKITIREGKQTAVDLLDTLRGLRQEHKTLRMVFTGSIGLHHVIDELCKGYATNYAPLNNMQHVEAPPLDEKDAITLIKILIESEKISAGEDEETAVQIASSVDCVPYYIHHTIAAMVDQGVTATPEQARRVISEALEDPQDSWDFRHYRNRLETYYKDRAPLARLILDTLAEDESEDGLSWQELLDQARLRFRGDDAVSRRLLEKEPKGFRNLIELMWQDYYFKRDNMRYTFRFGLIRRWWRKEV